MTQRTRVVLFGATGRMGATVAQCVSQDPAATLVGSIHRSDTDEREGRDLHGLLVSVDDLLGQADVAIDFTLPQAVERHVALCGEHRVPYVCGVTALPDSTLDALALQASSIPVLWAPNMSPGVTICFAAAADMARRLSSGGGGSYEVAITDIHHSGKLDAPSGTALEFGRVIAKASLTEPAITYDSVREGSHPGEHHILFKAGGDQIELRHKAGDRGEFASGALRAASWLIGQPSGLYNMRNVLGITSSS
ncbi:MAG: 4-hydroxy-tetrahydrodipicolinate reductase [Gammaproteobacteria bacterium]